MSTSLVPGDPGYSAALASGTGAVIGYGAFVDLPAYDGAGALRTYAPGYVPSAGVPVPQFNQVWDSRSGFGNAASTPGVYDTWSRSTTSGDDADGLDNNNNGIIDEPQELQQSAPPYAVPLQAVQIRLRVYDPKSGSVKEVRIQKRLSP